MSFSFGKKIFTDLFPPPQFLAMPTVGLDISDECVRVIKLRKRSYYYELDFFASQHIPQGILGEGYINDKASLTKILTELKREHGFHFIVASLPEDKSYLFKTKSPVMSERDVRNALQFKIEENVPVSLKDAVFDFTVLPFAPGSKELDLTVTVLHRKVVESYLEVFHGAGLVPLRLMTESQAMVQALIPEGDLDTHILVIVRETKTVLLIVAGGAIHFTSTVQVGGNDISESLKKELHMSDEDIKHLKQGKDIKNKKEMFESVVNAASVLRDEIQKLFSYWENRGGGTPVHHLLLGGSDSLVGLDAYLARSFTVPVSIANVWKHITPLGEYVPQLTRQESLDYIPALGLALSHD
jgi:type IV pilus assembly protein PilM